MDGMNKFQELYQRVKEYKMPNGQVDAELAHISFDALMLFQQEIAAGKRDTSCPIEVLRGYMLLCDSFRRLLNNGGRVVFIDPPEAKPNV